MTRTIKVAQFGTFDLTNYGDLLFPLIASRQLAGMAGLQLQLVSPVGQQPAFKDTLPSIGIHDFIDGRNPPDGLLIGGGNIIQTAPSQLRNHAVGARDRLAYSDLWIGAALFSPGQVPILWNAPGVSGPFPKDHYSLVQEALIRTSYLSVRDEMSRQYLLDVWPTAEIAIVPDTSWNVDSLWTSEQLAATYAALFAARGLEPPERSVVLHVRRQSIGQTGMQALSQKLDAIARKLSAVPIIIATGSCHGDDVLSREVARYMVTSPVVLDTPHTLQEIASCIAYASFYAGSSMQGLITASVFGVPGLCVANGESRFSGLADFHGTADVLASAWEQVPDLLPSLLSESHRLNLLSVRTRARTELQVHWRRIQSELESTRDRQLSPDSQHRPSWAQFADYQYKALTAQADAQAREQRSAKQVEVSNLNKEIKDLRAEIRRVHNSLSWRLTRPLRSIAHRLPRLALLGERILYAVKNALVMKLSSVAAATVVDNRWEPSEDIKKQIAAYREVKAATKRKIVFYTAIFGEYDNLLLPDQIDPDIDYICFTDRPRNNYGVWQMRSAPFYHPDPTRIARYVKTHPHELFPEHEVAVWLDANIILRGDVHKYIEMVKLQGAHLGFVPHPHRDCFYEEAEACKRLGKDAVGVIDRQVDHYLKRGLPPNQPLFETGFMVADLSNPGTSEALTTWWQQIEQFSRRDQLGLAWVIFQHPNLQIVPLLPSGTSVRDHDDFRYFRHNFARVLKVPEDLLQLGSRVNPGYDISFSEVKDLRLKQLIDVPIDIIVCVHNALEDVRLCLQSAREHLLPKHRIIIVNDRSDAETSAYLRQFAAGDEQVTLIENEENLGYTRSASLGLASGEAGFRILLNSDTIVSENWALKMLDVANSSDTIGIVGPLSNAAGAQSIPYIKSTANNTAINTLPGWLSPADLDLACERWSFADQFPRVPLVHGFCFGVKKEVIDRIGLFDDQNFKRYYGEENDYCFRAQAAGFEFALATNTFVFHRKSRSIEEEMRIIHMAEAGQRLREIYGADKISMACLQVEDHPLLERIRKEAASYFEAGQAKHERRQELTADKAG